MSNDAVTIRSTRPKENVTKAMGPEPDMSDEGETIGSRLRRKRRLAATSFMDENTLTIKRARQTLSPSSKNATPTTSQPIPYGNKRKSRIPSKKADVALEAPDSPHSNGGNSLRTIANGPDQAQEKVESEQTDPKISNEQPVSLSDLPLFAQYKQMLPTAIMADGDESLRDEVTQKVIDHLEKLAGLKQLSQNYGKGMDTDGLPTMGADTTLQTQALAILGNLTKQILHAFATNGIHDMIRILAEPESKAGSTYGTLKKLFDNTKKVYPSKDAFLSITELGNLETNAVSVIRNANLATFITSCFGSGEVGFYHLNEYFLDTFVNDGSRLLKQQAGLFLDLKTQAYLSAMATMERPKAVILTEMFPENLEERLMVRRAGAKSLAPSESEFLERVRNRRKNLEDEPDTRGALETLRDRYMWESFLLDLSNYLNKNFETIVDQPIAEFSSLGGKSISTPRSLGAPEVLRTKQDSPTEPRPRPQTPSGPVQTLQEPPPRPESSYYPAPPPYIQSVPPPLHNGSGPGGPQDKGNVVAKTARAAPEVVQGYAPHGQPVTNGAMMQPPGPLPGHPQMYPGPPHPYPGPPQFHHELPPPPLHLGHPFAPPQRPPSAPHQRPAHHLPPGHPGHRMEPPYIQYPLPPPPHGHPGHLIYSHPSDHGMPPYYPPPPYMAGRPHPYHGLPQPPPGYTYAGEIPNPRQSAPTAVLYERARQVANNKSSNSSRSKTANISQRRPWTTEEEQALMAGLDNVKGPHWSQILALYGPGGTVNEALQSRSQVQLKDKARNLKLFFLKSKIEVPYYLQFVTGELKSRAPSHAALDESGHEIAPDSSTMVSDSPIDYGTPTQPADHPMPSIENQPPPAHAPSGPYPSPSPIHSNGVQHNSPYTSGPGDSDTLANSAAQEAIRAINALPPQEDRKGTWRPGPPPPHHNQSGPPPHLYPPPYHFGPHHGPPPPLQGPPLHYGGPYGPPSLPPRFPPPPLPPPHHHQQPYHNQSPHFHHPPQPRIPPPPSQRPPSQPMSLPPPQRPPSQPVPLPPPPPSPHTSTSAPQIQAQKPPLPPLPTSAPPSHPLSPHANHAGQGFTAVNAGQQPYGKP